MMETLTKQESKKWSKKMALLVAFAMSTVKKAGPNFMLYLNQLQNSKSRGKNK